MGRPKEQCRPQLRLQILDLTAQGRLRDRQLLRGFCEAFLLRHCFEIPDMPQFHLPTSSFHAFSKNQLILSILQHVVFSFIILFRYYYTSIICISHYKRNMVNYNHQKEVRPDPLSITTKSTVHLSWKG